MHELSKTTQWLQAAYLSVHTLRQRGLLSLQGLELSTCSLGVSRVEVVVGTWAAKELLLTSDPRVRLQQSLDELVRGGSLLHDALLLVVKLLGVQVALGDDLTE